MRWTEGRRSDRVEDRRGRRLPGGGKALGGGSLLLVIVVALLFGQNPLDLLNQVASTEAVSPNPTSTAVPSETPREALDDFVRVMLASTEDTWSMLFEQAGGAYPPPRLVLFSDAVQSACGMSSAATGPFYCPADQQIYIDLSFLSELERLGAEGDFAFAYVIGHEVGHHIQHISGQMQNVRERQAGVSQQEANALSVRLELQADCYAGVWAHHANAQWEATHGYPLLERGDIEEGLTAAAAIGDDRLQARSGRVVQPEAFTHGTSRQRAGWLQRGLEVGLIQSCQTY